MGHGFRREKSLAFCSFFYRKYYEVKPILEIKLGLSQKKMLRLRHSEIESATS